MQDEDQSARTAPPGSVSELAPNERPTELDLFQCSKGLKIVLLRMTRDPDLASDLTQDVLETVLIALREGRIHSKQALPAYLHTCAKNMVFANARRAKRMVLDNDAENHVQCDSTPLDQYEKAELALLAQKVLSELSSERDRALINGFYALGQPKAELMQRWQLDKDHFDKVLSRARARMRELMSEKLTARPTALSGLSSVGNSNKTKGK